MSFAEFVFANTGATPSGGSYMVLYLRVKCEQLILVLVVVVYTMDSGIVCG